MAKPVEVHEDTFDQIVLESETPVLVDFWAPGCRPCQMVAPVVEELAEEYGDRLSFAKVNVDDDGKVATRYGIQSIPTLLLFSKGKLVHQVVGFKPKGELKRILDAAVA